MTLNSLTIAAARDALRKKDVTAVELTDACLAARVGRGGLGLAGRLCRSSRAGLDFRFDDAERF